MVIRFQPRKLGAKPDTLTRRWDVYCKGGNSDFTTANPSNLCPIFTNKQLTASLWATYYATPIIQSAIIMDVEQLYNTIRESYALDPVTAAHFLRISDPRWTIDDSGLLHRNDRIMLMIFDSRYYNTNMITFYPDTLVKIRHSSLYDENMYGLNFEPLSSIFAIHAPLANTLKHHNINPMDY